MVLVAPHPVGERGQGSAPEPPVGAELLALLRDGADDRPRFDPGLAGGLRAWLEDAAYGLVAARGEDARPLVLGPRRLLGTPEPRWAEGGGGDDEPRAAPSAELVLSRLVHALFRQVVTVGSVDDPLGDALDALRALGGEDDVVEHIESLAPAARAGLAATVSSHAARLRAVVPRLAPGWMPRTDDRVAIPLAGGRVVLHGVFDLLIGSRQPGVSSLCALGLSTGGPWARERRTLHYLAVLETLRSGTPPYRLALLESASGRYGVEDVREEHLRAMVAHLTAWLAEGAGSP
jgi:hypothetical protein